MEPGDLVQILGSHGESLEVTAVIGTIIAPWKIPGWWIVLVNGQVMQWDGNDMMKIDTSCANIDK